MFPEPWAGVSTVPGGRLVMLGWIWGRCVAGMMRRWGVWLLVTTWAPDVKDLGTTCEQKDDQAHVKLELHNSG